MKFKNKLIPAKFQKRYKRFFVDVLNKDKIITSHCPNSGSMLGLLNINNKTWISKADNPDRKLKYTLEIINDGSSNVGVNTHLANRIVEEAIEQKKIKEIIHFPNYRREVKFGTNSRFDFEISNNSHKVFLEVKNVTLSRTKKIAEFPDAVTSRGLKHLQELEKAISKGYDCYLLFLVQREDCKRFQIAKDIDPLYYEGFLRAKKNGVKFISYSCKVSEKEIYIHKPITIIF